MPRISRKRSRAGGTLAVVVHHQAFAGFAFQNAIANVNTGEMRRASVAALDEFDIIAHALQATLDLFIAVL